MLRKNRLTLAVSAAIGLSTALSTPILAQDEGELVEEVVVTGSRIARDQFSGPTPVISIDSESIKTSGFISTQDVLDSLTQNTGGSLTQQESFGFTPAASGIDLRGAGLGRTLTLIDGIRVPKYPVAAGGTVSFSDTSNIPVGAIDRIEVLTAGASAIYGADAMGGVVNIIMKDQFEGMEINVRASDTDEGGRATYNVSLLGGTVSDKSSTMFFIEYEDRDELMASDRSNFDIGNDLAFDNDFGSYSSYGAALRDFSGIPVRTLDPEECEARAPGFKHWDYAGVGICGFNRTSYRQLAPEQDRLSTMVRNKYSFADNLTLSTRINYTHSTLYTKIEPMPIDDYTFYLEDGTVTALSDRSGNTAEFDQATAFGGDFADLPDAGYFYTHRAWEFGGREGDYKSDNFSFATELTGALGNHDWSLGYNWARQKQDNKSINYASAESFFRYITGETNGNPTGNSLVDVIPESDVETVRYTPNESNESTLTGLYLSFTGDMFELPAGTLKYAAGLETYKEWFVRTADEASSNNEILSTGASGGRGTREWDSAYAELLIPVIGTFELTTAVRYDDYSDFGDSTVWQVAGEWRPLDNLLLRASWGETFRAPDLARVYGDPVFGFNQVTDPLGCTNAGGVVGETSTIPACIGELFVDVNTGANPDLDAETGESWNIGAVYEFELAGNWQTSIDWWHVEIDDIVDELDAQTIANDPVTYGSQITRRAGFIDVINANALNLSFQEVEGIDFAVKNTLDTGIGTFITSITATYTLDYKDQFTTDDPVRDVIKESSVPEWKANFKVDWLMQQFSATMFLTYLGEMEGINSGDFADFGLTEYKVEDQWKLNLSAGYMLGDNWNFRVGVNNVTDEGPNQDPTDTGWPEYNRSFYNAIGREYYGSINWKF